MHKALKVFFGLTTDLDKYNIGCVVLETLDKICMYAQDYSKTFVAGLRALKFLSYSEVSSKLVLCKYLLEVFKNEGFAINTEYCSNCKKPLSNNMFFSFVENTIVCESCREINAINIKPATISAIKILNQNGYDDLKTVKLNDFILDSLFKFLTIAFCSVFETKLKTLSLLD